jgi:hypothetical protein
MSISGGNLAAAPLRLGPRECPVYQTNRLGEPGPMGGAPILAVVPFSFYARFPETANPRKRRPRLPSLISWSDIVFQHTKRTVLVFLARWSNRLVQPMSRSRSTRDIVSVERAKVRLSDTNGRAVGLWLWPSSALACPPLCDLNGMIGQALRPAWLRTRPRPPRQLCPISRFTATMIINE